MNKERMKLAIEILNKDCTDKIVNPNPSFPPKRTICDTAACSAELIGLDDRTELKNEWNDNYLNVTYGKFKSCVAIAEWLDVYDIAICSIFRAGELYFDDETTQFNITTKHIAKLLEYYMKNERLPDHLELTYGEERYE